MDKKILRRKWIKDCIPTILSLLLSGIYSVVDGLFIGRAAGDAGLAAVNLAWPFPAIITATGIGVGMGGSILYSNSMGNKEDKRGDVIYHQTVVLLILAGMIMTGLLYWSHSFILKFLGASGNVAVKAGDYSRVIILGSVFQTVGAGVIPILRNRGRVLGAMVSMTTGMLANLGLNYVFIFQLDQGVRGAAAGTVIAQLLTAVLGFLMLYEKGKEGFRVLFDWKGSVSILKTGFSAFGLSIAPSMILIFANKRCLQYGGDAAVACYAVISYITFPVQYILTGIGDGSQPLMSYYSGARRKEELRFVRKTAERFALLTGLVLTIVVYAAKPWIPSLFGMSLQSGKYFDTGMSVTGLAFVFMGVVKFRIAYMNATLRIKSAAFLIYGETLLIMPVLLFVMPAVWGIHGIWAAFPTGQILMLLFFNIGFTGRKSNFNIRMVRYMREEKEKEERRKCRN